MNTKETKMNNEQYLIIRDILEQKRKIKRQAMNTKEIKINNEQYLIVRQIIDTF